MAEESGAAKVAELIKDIRIAMLTTQDVDGKLVSHPMGTQDVDFDGDIWFIAERSSHKVANLQARPQVNVAYASNSSWVSVSGTAEVVDDEAKLKEFWNMFVDAWLEGGPENPNNILIHVAADSAEYWDTPGSRVTQLVNLVKVRVTGDQIDAGNERVEL